MFRRGINSFPPLTVPLHQGAVGLANGKDTGAILGPKTSVTSQLRIYFSDRLYSEEAAIRPPWAPTGAMQPTMESFWTQPV